MFEIPSLIKEKESTMKKELLDASEAELERLDQLSDEQVESMKGFEDKEQEYVEKGGMRFRKIDVLDQDMLKNGMKVQISICDPSDRNLFLPLDKVLVYKHGEKYHATGSFCGFDFTNLDEGVYLGDKISCPTCGSIYNITNGLIEQGPSMRNLASFPIQIRKNKVQLVVPDHIPAFAMRETLTEENLDPRTMVIIGDSEAALSAIITLRYAFVGKIIVVPTSSYGSFENKDVLTRKFGPLQKEEVYYVEPDLFNKAKVEVKNSEVVKIDHDERIVYFKDKTKVPFEAVLFAGGSYKSKTSNFMNVHVISDYESHAKAYNAVLKADHVCILGSTFEAFQMAASIRKYFRDLNFADIKITVLDNETSEIRKTLGTKVTQRIFKELRDNMKISILNNVNIAKVDGDHTLKRISFTQKEGDYQEYFIKPDVVIQEKSLGKVDHTVHNTIFFDKPKFRPELDENGAFKIDKRFSIMTNINYQGLFATGQNALHHSFLGNKPFRTSDVKFNIETGFYAALQMLYKEVKFEYIPLTRLTIGNKEIYYYGERDNVYDEILVDGDINSNKFVVYYLRGDVVCGFLTFGYKNLHLFLIEAMKLLQMPPGK